MQSELKEFLSRLLPTKGWRQRVKGLFVRNRVPPEAKTFASYVYMSQGSSLRRTKELLHDLGVRVSHVSIWKWIQTLGRRIKARLSRRKRRRCLVVDETKMKTKNGQIYVFAAVDPENREIVNLLITRWRGLMDTLGFLRRTLRFCEGKPIIATDGGPWYRWPAQRLGLKHVVLCGGERNYVERWFETFKDRLRTFDCYFPTSGLQTVENFCSVFCFWYNECRGHMSLGRPPSGGEGGFKAWLEVLS
jgi:transposase-like protein